MKKYKVIKIINLVLLAVVVLASCRKNEPEPEPTIIGELTVALDANVDVVRKKEALIGNFITEALSQTVRSKGHELDFCLINSGSIRFDEQKRPNGIYPSGSITNNDIIEMLPFGDVTTIVTLTGNQLKEILERSVAQYPLAKGPFLQLSEEIRITVDTLAAEQQLNATETAIISPGARITSIKINGNPYEPSANYKVLVINFLASGEDGFVTFNSIPDSQKEVFTEYIFGYVNEYVILNSPITTVLDGRIEFQ